MIGRMLALFLLLSSPVTWGQSRYPSGEFRGLSKWQWETEIIKLDKPIVVREVDGKIIRSVGDGSPLEGVHFEIRGPGRSQNIRSTTTGADGKFHLNQTPSGRYLFKATTLGFATFVGVIIVSPKAEPDQCINLQMIPGS
jgi:hypothetical protein